MRDVRRGWALALVGLLFVAGCTQDEPEPKMPDPSPTSSEPSPSATETETAEAESAEEFIRRWAEVNTQMQNTGTIDEYSALSSKCRPCIQTAQRIEQIYSDGGFVKTEGWILDGVVNRSGETGRPVLDLQIESSPTLFKESADAKTQSLPGGNIIMRVRLSREAPWQVMQLTQVAS